MSNSVSIIIPTYKEANFIEDTLNRFISICRLRQFDFEIIVVVDHIDGDQTLEIVKKTALDKKEIVMIVNHGKQGVGKAIKVGIKKASKDITIIAVAGRHLDPNDAIKMVDKFDGKTDMVFGDRFSKKIRLTGYPLSKLVANRLCNFAVSVLFGIRARDITSGVKAYKTEILKKIDIESKGFEIFIELPLKSFLMGYKKFEVIVLTHHHRDQEFSHFNLASEWSKYFRLIMRCYRMKITRDKSSLLEMN